MKVKINRLNENAVIPTYGTPLSAGCDLYASEDIIIPPYKTALVPTGLVLDMDKDTYCRLYIRSSMAYKTDLTLGNNVGIIDSDYRGEVKVMLYNRSRYFPVTIHKGDRIAQLVFDHYEQAEFEEVDELTGTKRGVGGFGSTGK